MNKNKKDYSKGKIYCIRSHKTDLIYVGSTCQPLSKRLNKHKTAYKTYLKTGKIEYTSSKIYELDESPYIELIVNYPCSCLDELRREEGKFIRSMDCVNRKIEGRTKKEWYEDNKEHIKEYYEQNKEKIKEYQKQYKEDNKEQMKQWREDNKDKKKEYDKEYRRVNKEKINQKITCACGSTYTKHQKKRHERTDKHKQFINLL